MFVAYIWLAFYFLAPAAARETDDTQPGDLVGWQAENNHRSTWNIISNCLATIFACTWSVQHLNVPGGRQDGEWNRRLRSVKWMIITILFFELVVIHAILEFIMAYQALCRMHHAKKDVEWPWWLQRPSLSLLVKRLSNLLKGFPCPSNSQKDKDSEKQAVDDRKWTLTHCFFGNMGGFICTGEPPFPLTALQVAEEEGFEKPTITEEEIADKSKQDWFAKGVAVLGFLQLALSLIVRTNKGLDFSQLETVTLVFAVCGAVIYLVYLYKPQKVDTALLLEHDRKVPPLLFKKTYDSFWYILTNESGRVNTEEANPSPHVPHRIPNDNIPISGSRVAHPSVFLLAFASGIFGAMHAIAWRFEFPSTVEKILWQTATVVAAGSPVVGLVTIPFAQWTVPAGDPQLFAENVLRLMRDYSWNADNKGLAHAAYEKLEDSLIKLEEVQHYASILAPKQNGGQTLDLGPDLHRFLDQPDPSVNQSDLYKDKEFIQNFKRLVCLVRGEGSKKLVDTAVVGVFPRKNLLPASFNLAVLYTTGLLYCLSRVSLLVVAVSSLRQMPASVYVNTPWTEYIPTLKLEPPPSSHPHPPATPKIPQHQPPLLLYSSITSPLLLQFLFFFFYLTNQLRIKQYSKEDILFILKKIY